MIVKNISDGIGLLELNYGKVNAMDIELCRHWIESLRQFSEDQNCQSIVLGTRGSVFSAGIDLKRWLREDEEYVEPYLLELENLMMSVLTCCKPIIADISGAAIAGGCMVATACDYRILSDNAKIGILESRLGVPLPVTAIEILRHVALESSFRKITTMGATYSGSEAVAAGLVDEVVPGKQSRMRAIQMAQELSKLDQRAFELTKKQRLAPVVRVIDQNRKQFYQQYLAIWKSDQTRDAIATYVEDRL